MIKYCRIGIAAALLCVGGGVAAAEPAPLQDVNQDVFTDEGYHFIASLNKMTVNSVPNMAATAFSREAFVSATATEIIDGSEKQEPYPVSGGKLEMALQLGCQIDLTQGLQMTFGQDESLSLGDPFRIPGAAPSLPVPTLSDFIPNVTVNLRPGSIKYVTIGKQNITPDGGADAVAAKTINDNRYGALRLTVRDAYITVDSCGGPVSARVVAVAQMRTQTGSFDELNLYGDIVSI